jgi:hypothetical protein
VSASTRRKAVITADCILLAAIGVRYGYTHVAFFLPGVTLQKLRGLRPAPLPLKETL